VSSRTGHPIYSGEGLKRRLEAFSLVPVFSFLFFSCWKFSAPPCWALLVFPSRSSVFLRGCLLFVRSRWFIRFVSAPPSRWSCLSAPAPPLSPALALISIRSAPHHRDPAHPQREARGRHRRRTARPEAQDHPQHVQVHHHGREVSW